MELLKAAFLTFVSLVVCVPKLCVFLKYEIWMLCFIHCDYNGPKKLWITHPHISNVSTRPVCHRVGRGRNEMILFFS